MIIRTLVFGGEIFKIKVPHLVNTELLKQLKCTSDSTEVDWDTALACTFD